MSTFRRSNARHGRQGGQALPLLVGGIAAVLALTALVVDGGNAWAQQRIVQNATDAVAEAGAVTLAQMWAGQTAPAAGWDAATATAMAQMAAQNEIPTPPGYYTDVCGTLLTPTGAAAADTSTAAQVGSGQMPPTNANWPTACPSATPGPPSGVLVNGARQFHTYLAAALGISTMSASATATAVSGFLQAECDAISGCALLPVMLPVFLLQCSSNNQVIWPPSGQPWPLNTVLTVPLCQNGPGNVGWVDWTPPAGGTKELVQSIETPNNPPIPVPSWQYISQTGNINSGDVETALRAYDGQIVLIPMFDNTCDAQPTGNGVNDCPSGHLSGNGQQQWYHVAQFAAFQLCGGANDFCGATYQYGAYIQGNNQAICANGGNGGTSCLAGRFVKYVTGTTVVRPPSGGGSTVTSIVGVQLIH